MHGMPAAAATRMTTRTATKMATKTKRPSEAWTIPLHVVMWTVMTVGFIMTLVVLLLH
jgi:hypothetical protein